MHLFFGTEWRAPLVLVVLAAFAGGLIVGVLGMVPRWWEHRRAATRARQSITIVPEQDKSPAAAPPHGL